MKFYRNLAIALAMFITALLALKYFSEKPGRTARSTASTAAAPQTAVSIPTAPQPAYVAPTPTPGTGPTPVATYAYAGKIAEMAQKARVEVTRYSESGGRVNVVVHWIGDSSGPGGDFLDEGLKAGAFRDFKDRGSNVYFDRQGRRNWEAAYELYMY